MEMLEKDNHFECSAAEWDCVCKLQDFFFQVNPIAGFAGLNLSS
jgi:hypothetical protein